MEVAAQVFYGICTMSKMRPPTNHAMACISSLAKFWSFLLHFHTFLLHLILLLGISSITQKARVKVHKKGDKHNKSLSIKD